MTRLLQFIGVFLAALSIGFAAPILTLDPPDGAISGPAGSAIGWGYTLSNDDPNLWYVPTSLSNGIFLHATPTLLFDFPTLGPGTGVTVAFNAAKGFGLFQLDIDANAMPPDVNSGLFTLGGEWWSGDPFLGGVFISDAPDATSAYSASVADSPAPPDAPEPSTIVLLAAGMLMLTVRAERITAKRRVP